MEKNHYCTYCEKMAKTGNYKNCPFNHKSPKEFYRKKLQAWIDDYKKLHQIQKDDIKCLKSSQFDIIPFLKNGISIKEILKLCRN